MPVWHSLQRSANDWLMKAVPNRRDESKNEIGDYQVGGNPMSPDMPYKADLAVNCN